LPVTAASCAIAMGAAARPPHITKAESACRSMLPRFINAPLLVADPAESFRVFRAIMPPKTVIEKEFVGQRR
jgi:hypothetical protein